MLRKLLSKLVVYAVPQLKFIINKEVSFYNLEHIERELERDSLTRVVSPSRVLNAKIGKGTYVSVNTKIFNTTIGKFCSIGPNFLCGWGIHPANGLSTSPYFYSTAKQNGDTLAKEDLFKEREQITLVMMYL